MARLLLLTLALAGCSSQGTAASGPQVAVVTVCPEGKTLGASGRCEAAPAPVAGPATRPRPAHEAPSEVAELAGSWLGEDSMASARYELVIERDGRFSQTITTLDGSSGRPEGSCTQDGTVAIADGQFVWRYHGNTCNSAYENSEASDTLAERSDRTFVLTASGYQVHYTRQR